MRRTFRTCSARGGGSPGFTLLELLVVTLILGLVIAAIGACMAGGIRAWDTARSFAAVESEALVGLQILQRDLMNTFRFHGVPFKGESTQMSFAGRLPVAGEGPDRLGTVAYAFDAGHRALIRRTWVYDPDAPSEAGAVEAVMNGLTDVSLQYYAKAVPEPYGEGVTDTWNSPTGLPRRVTLDITFASGGGNVTLGKTWLLPGGEQP